MLRDDDIETAIRNGVITRAQADAMRAAAGEARKARVFALGREERFRILGGFNDFFIAVGVLLLGGAIWYGAVFARMPNFTDLKPGMTFDMSGFYHVIFAWSAVGAAVMWGLAEYLTGRLKLVAPSIVAVGFLAMFVNLAVSYAVSSTVFGYGLKGAPGAVLYGSHLPGIVTIAVLVAHYYRFRLPFTLFVLAIAAVLFVIAVYLAIARRNFGLSPADSATHIRWLALVLGLAVFAWAMWFDTSDPERLTRRADCGFWLHLLAAPLIVHPLAGRYIQHWGFMPGSLQPTAPDATMLVSIAALTLLLAVVALIVDRRSLLVTGLGYLGLALASAFESLPQARSLAGVIAMLLIGALIITLGVGWRALRSYLMRLLPAFPGKSRLPPYL